MPNIAQQLSEYRTNIEIVEDVFGINFTEECSKGVDVHVYPLKGGVVAKVTLYHAASNKATIQHCKRTFGTLKDGVYKLEEVIYNGRVSSLKGRLELAEHPLCEEGDYIDFGYYGAYDCKLDHYEEVTQDKVANTVVGTETVKKPIYYCGPAPMPED